MLWPLLVALLASQSVAAKSLAESLLIVDANILTPYRITLDPADLRARTDRGEFDVPRALEGGLDLAVMGMLIPASEAHPKAYADARIDRMLELAASSSDVSIVTSSSDVRATRLDVVDHIDHAVELAGIDHLGVGSGFDGSGDAMPDGLKDASDYPALIDELLRRRYRPEEIEKILGGNFMRVLREVERIAGL